MRSNVRRISNLLSALGVASVLMAGAGKAQAITVQDITKCQYGGDYSIVWDGWQGDIVFYSQGNGALYASNQVFPVRYALYNPQDIVSGYSGPGYRGVNTTATYRIVFWVDFNKTPSNPNDDQRFDGYVMTQTRNAMAGVTWWNNQPFGFYTKFAGCIVP